MILVGFLLWTKQIRGKEGRTDGVVKMASGFWTGLVGREEAGGETLFI